MTSPPDGPQEKLVRMVHDLRTPLTIVQGFADLLQTRDDLTEEQRAEFLARIREAATEMRLILDDERAERLGEG